ncbi:MAG TPA: hypothetical protein VN819_00300 [Thermoplasmata archaeon]|nr:hypothetical protein [Thermoplasmata archaeon]
MADPEAGPPLIRLPERLDRRMRLGPFPSSRDALKFVTYAAAGALLSPFTSPWVWLPVLLAGFAVSVWRPDGRAVDERILAYSVWKFRSFAGESPVRNASSHPLVRQGLLQLAPHRYVAVVRTGGTPMAYLPPDELARRFELYRELLRSTGEGFSFLATAVPIRSQAVRPVAEVAGDPQGRARSGYSELVLLLCRRRLLRRVYLVLGTLEEDRDAVGRLEGRVANLTDRLTSLGLKPTRLRDRALAEAARRFGWPTQVVRT